MYKEIVNAKVSINGESIKYKANTLFVDLGGAALEVKGLAGGSDAVAYYTQDIESATSGVKFEVIGTIENVALFRRLKNLSNVEITVTSGEDIVFSSSDQILISKPEFDLKMDGGSTMEFRGTSTMQENT